MSRRVSHSACPTTKKTERLVNICRSDMNRNTSERKRKAKYEPVETSGTGVELVQRCSLQINGGLSLRKNEILLDLDLAVLHEDQSKRDVPRGQDDKSKPLSNGGELKKETQPDGFILFGLDVSRSEESVLLQVQLVTVLSGSHHRVTDLFINETEWAWLSSQNDKLDTWTAHLLSPGVSNLGNVNPRGFLDSLPEILSGSVSVGVGFQVGRHTLQELVFSHNLRDHSENRTSLTKTETKSMLTLGHMNPGREKGKRIDTLYCKR